MEVQCSLLGLRGLEPCRGIPPSRRLASKSTLRRASPFRGRRSPCKRPSTAPTRAAPAPTSTDKYSAFAVACIASTRSNSRCQYASSTRCPWKRIVGTGEHKLKLFEDEDEDEDDVGPDGQKRRRPSSSPLKPKPLTAGGAARARDAGYGLDGIGAKFLGRLGDEHGRRSRFGHDESRVC